MTVAVEANSHTCLQKKNYEASGISLTKYKIMCIGLNFHLKLGMIEKMKLGRNNIVMSLSLHTVNS